MGEALHPILERQLRRVGLAPASCATIHAALRPLLDRVSRAYAESEQERYVLERSQEIVSREMADLNAELTASQARLASLLSLSADWIWEQDAALRFTYLSEHVSEAGHDLSVLLVGKRAVVDLAPLLEVDAARYDTLVKTRQPFRNVVCRLVQPGDLPFYVRISGEPVFDGDVFRGYRGVGSDVDSGHVVGAAGAAAGAL